MSSLEIDIDISLDLVAIEKLRFFSWKTAYRKLQPKLENASDQYSVVRLAVDYEKVNSVQTPSQLLSYLEEKAGVTISYPRKILIKRPFHPGTTAHQFNNRQGMMEDLLSKKEYIRRCHPNAAPSLVIENGEETPLGEFLASLMREEAEEIPVRLEVNGKTINLLVKPNEPEKMVLSRIKSFIDPDKPDQVSKYAVRNFKGTWEKGQCYEVYYWSIL